MKKNTLALLAVICTTVLNVSCKKDYQKLSMEFIRNLPDTCELMVQVENEVDHFVYYKSQRQDAFFRYNLETEDIEIITIPKLEGAKAYNIGVGKENILIGHKENENDTVGSHVHIQLYNLQTLTFKKFTTCNWYKFYEGTKQVACFTYNTDIFGDGSCTIDTYDFDGNLLTKKDTEVSRYKEVPSGTLAARRQATSAVFKQSNTPYYYCQLCGAEFNTVRDVTNNTCPRRGFGEKHILYEGSEKEQYACKFCGAQFRTIRSMTFNTCPRRGHGEKHIPAL